MIFKRLVMNKVVPSAGLLALAAMMAGCAGAAQVPSADAASDPSAGASPAPAKTPTADRAFKGVPQPQELSTVPPGDEGAGDGATGEKTQGALVEADSPGPLEGTVYVVSTHNVVGPEQIAGLMPVALEDTEEAAFHTAFMLMNTSDDVYAAAPDRPGDLSLFAAISAPECGWCASVMDTATMAAASNLRVTGGDFTATGDDFDGSRMLDGSVVVNIPVTEEPTRVWSPDGTLAQSSDGAASLLNIQLEWREDLWMVTAVSLD